MKLAGLLRTEKLHFLLTFGWLLNLSQVSVIKFFPESGKFSLFLSENFSAALHKNIFCTNFDFFSRTLEGFLEQLLFVFGGLCDIVVHERCCNYEIKFQAQVWFSKVNKNYYKKVKFSAFDFKNLGPLKFLGLRIIFLK